MARTFGWPDLPPALKPEIITKHLYTIASKCRSPETVKATIKSTAVKLHQIEKTVATWERKTNSMPSPSTKTSLSHGHSRSDSVLDPPKPQPTTATSTQQPRSWLRHALCMVHDINETPPRPNPEYLLQPTTYDSSAPLTSNTHILHPGQTFTWTCATDATSLPILRDTDMATLADWEALYYIVLQKLRDLHWSVKAHLLSGRRGAGDESLLEALSVCWAVLNQPALVATLNREVKKVYGRGLVSVDWFVKERLFKALETKFGETEALGGEWAMVLLGEMQAVDQEVAVRVTREYVRAGPGARVGSKKAFSAPVMGFVGRVEERQDVARENLETKQRKKRSLIAEDRGMRRKGFLGRVRLTAKVTAEIWGI